MNTYHSSSLKVAIPLNYPELGIEMYGNISNKNKEENCKGIFSVEPHRGVLLKLITKALSPYLTEESVKVLYATTMKSPTNGLTVEFVERRDRALQDCRASYASHVGHSPLFALLMEFLQSKTIGLNGSMIFGDSFLNGVKVLFVKNKPDPLKNPKTWFNVVFLNKVLDNNHIGFLCGPRIDNNNCFLRDNFEHFFIEQTNPEPGVDDSYPLVYYKPLMVTQYDELRDNKTTSFADHYILLNILESIYTQISKKDPNIFNSELSLALIGQVVFEKTFNPKQFLGWFISLDKEANSIHGSQNGPTKVEMDLFEKYFNLEPYNSKPEITATRAYLEINLIYFLLECFLGSLAYNDNSCLFGLNWNGVLNDYKGTNSNLLAGIRKAVSDNDFCVNFKYSGPIMYLDPNRYKEIMLSAIDNFTSCIPKLIEVLVEHEFMYRYENCNKVDINYSSKKKYRLLGTPNSRTNSEQVW